MCEILITAVMVIMSKFQSSATKYPEGGGRRLLHGFCVYLWHCMSYFCTHCYEKSSHAVVLIVVT